MFKEVTDLAIADELWEAKVLYYVLGHDCTMQVPERYWTLDISTNPNCKPTACPDGVYRYAVRLEE